jgi:hypothetical protein
LSNSPNFWVDPRTITTPVPSSAVAAVRACGLNSIFSTHWTGLLPLYERSELRYLSSSFTVLFDVERYSVSRLLPLKSQGPSVFHSVHLSLSQRILVYKFISHKIYEMCAKAYGRDKRHVTGQCTFIQGFGGET